VKKPLIRCLAGLLLATLSCHSLADTSASDIVKYSYDIATDAYKFGYQHQHCKAAGMDKPTREMLIIYNNMCEDGVKDRKAGLKPYPQAAGATLADLEGAAAVKEKRPDDAYKWFEIAARNGRLKAQVTLGQMYRMGYGGRKDCAKSVHWIETAAKTGYPKAQFEMAATLFEGVCLPQDYIAAEKWYTLAAEQKYAQAWTALAVMMNNGVAMARNDGGALLYLKVAEALGDPRAAELQKHFQFAPEEMKQIDHLFNNVMARINGASADHEPFTLHTPLGKSSSTQAPSQPASKNPPAPAAPQADVDFSQQALDEFAGASGMNLVGVPAAYKKTAGFLRGENRPDADKYAYGYLAWYYHSYRLRKAGAKPPPVVNSSPGTENYRRQVERLQRMIEVEEWLRKQKGDDVIADYGKMLGESVFAPISEARRKGKEPDFEALLIQAVNNHYQLHVTMAAIHKSWK